MVSAVMATCGVMMYWMLALYYSSFEIPGPVVMEFEVEFTFRHVGSYHTSITCRVHEQYLWLGPSAVKDYC